MKADDDFQKAVESPADSHTLAELDEQASSAKSFIGPLQIYSLLGYYTVLLAGSVALLVLLILKETSVEPLLESLKKLQVGSEVWFEPFGDKARRKICELGDLVTKEVASQGVRLSRMLQFKETLKPQASQLALPFLGHISNSFVEQHLRNTQHFRKLRVVATKPDHASPRELTTEDEVQALRDEKKTLIRNRGNTPEYVVLDREINYEIWSDGPEAQPHVESSPTKDKPHATATDSVYVLFSRPPFGIGEALLSVQPLHPLSLAAMSLFQRPLDTLKGEEADTFRLAAIDAMRDRNSIGFEAILNVQKNRQEGITETPRHFRGSPDLSAVTVSVKKAPQPLIQK